MLPICCYNCGKCISELEEDFLKEIEKNKEKNLENVLNNIGINKLCCRILFLTHINECKLLIK